MIDARREFPDMRLDLCRHEDGWNWVLWFRGRTIGFSPQKYSRRIDAVRSAENTTGITHIRQALICLKFPYTAHLAYAFRWTNGRGGYRQVDIRVRDERLKDWERDLLDEWDREHDGADQ